MKLIISTLCVLTLSLIPSAHAALVINEFMADNGVTLADAQGHYDDWVEIYNSGPGTVDLAGMYLTDNLLNPTQWQFPANTLLGAGNYLLVWADEDVLDNPNGLHADFKLSASGEQIGLYSTDGTTLLDSVSFGNQTEDVSYGRFPNGTGPWYFMDSPSPNSANTSAQSEEVYFSRLGGVMTTSFTLKLSTPSDTGEIRYTTDGSEPSGSSTLYNDITGISINNSASRRIRARAYQSGLAAGPVRTEAYLAASSALQSFDSNLPIVIIDTFGQAMPPPISTGSPVIHADPIFTYTSIIDTNKLSGRAAVTDQADYVGRSGVNIRGQSTTLLPKKQYKFETWNEDDQDKNVSLLGFPSDSDWILHAPHTDKTFMRNVMAYHLSREMGHYATRTKFVEVFMNEGGGQIGGSTSSDYLGVYVLMEKIKRGTGRVDIEELLPTENSLPEITGGYVIRHDKPRDGETPFTTWTEKWYYVEPSYLDITTAQKNYIKSYIEEFEGVLQGGSFADPVNGYAKYIDVESFIDHDLLSEISKEVDTYNFSTYVTKDRGGKLVMAPEWDFNWSMGNNFYSAWNPTAHLTTGRHRDASSISGWSPSWGYRWHNRLMDDPEYELKYADRWFHLRETVLSDATIAQTIDDHYALLNAEAAGRNFTKWNILNAFVGFTGWTDDPIPNFYYGGSPHLSGCTQDHTYGMQVEWFKNWLTGTGTPSGSCAVAAYASQYSDRLGWIDNDMNNQTGASAPPSLFINGSPADTGTTISVPDTLTMSGSSGTIYYTLDGTDPRQAFTGNAVGTSYSGGFSLNKTANVRARVRNGSDWTAMNQAVFADDRPLNDLRITEIMYHPSTPGEEYIELKNTGASSISLYLCEFTDGIEFTFPDITLAAGDHVLVVENQAIFEAKYGTGMNIAGEFDVGSTLDNSGEEIVLRDAAGREIHDFDYNDWYPASDGRGGSMCIIDPASADLTLWDQKIGWQASSALGGSPDAANPVNGVANGSIVINEALTHTDLGDGDWIELYNTTGASIDIGGWFLSDSSDDLKKYQIASGTSIAAGGYVVFTQVANFGVTASDPGKLTGFGLSELGDNIFLSSGAGGILSGGFSISEDFGAATREVTFGRHTKSAASGYGVDFVAMASPTMGAVNSGPLVPDVVISQIMYNPSADSDEVGEYIELANRTASAVDLYDSANPLNTWKFSKGIDYTFPTGVSIPAGKHVLVVRTDPDIFRYVHSIPVTHEIYGPYADKLANDGEKIELSMPGDPEPSFVPYIRTEKVNFSDGTHPVGSDPWPQSADGTMGHSLHRNVAANYGNDVANWLAAVASPISADMLFEFINIDYSAGNLTLQWTASGVLQSTSDLTNSWSNVPGATSPFDMVPDQPKQFFRIVE